MTRKYIANILCSINLLGGGIAFSQNGMVCQEPEKIDTETVLLINRPEVLKDSRALPGGPWHFSTLLRQMLPEGSSDTEVSEFISQWLNSFATKIQRPVDPNLPADDLENPVRTVNPRLDFERLVIRPWREKSQAMGLDHLALEYAPFKLVAIVNRLDTRDEQKCRSSAGEGRFVFAALSKPTNIPTEATEFQSLAFTLIFEYHLPTSFKSALSWAHSWQRLASVSETAAFNETLQSITDQFSTRGQLAGAPLGNPLAQIRTSEILSYPGDMREYELIAVGDSAQLRIKPPALTPHLPLNNSVALDEFFDESLDAVRTLSHSIPSSLQTLQAPTLIRRPWRFSNLSGLPDEEFESLRFQFSKATCNGCHSMEYPAIGNVDGVYHVSPKGELSSYLTQEALPERADHLCQLLNQTSCSDESEITRLRLPTSKRVH